MQSDKKGFAEIDVSQTSEATIIEAPTIGHIEIDHLNILPSGGANTIVFNNIYDGVSGKTKNFGYSIDDNRGFAFDNGNVSDNTLVLPDATAFTITPSAATQITGFVLFRIVG